MAFDLEWAFNTYSDAFLQDMMVVLGELQKEGITIPQILEYGKKEIIEKRMASYDQYKTARDRRGEYSLKARRCSCGQIMGLIEVNNSPGTMVGGVYKSMWFCPDLLGCGETVYSDRSIHDEAAAYGLGDFYPDPENKDMVKKQRRQHNFRLRTIHNQPNHPRPTAGRRKKR
jgi:hypothetical protein